LSDELLLEVPGCGPDAYAKKLVREAKAELEH
jgi:hypothetical protein